MKEFEIDNEIASVKSVTCDSCGKKIKSVNDNDCPYCLEVKGMVSLNIMKLYGDINEREVHVPVDLCIECLNKKLKGLEGYSWDTISSVSKSTIKTKSDEKITEENDNIVKNSVSETELKIKEENESREKKRRTQRTQRKQRIKKTIDKK